MVGKHTSPLEHNAAKPDFANTSHQVLENDFQLKDFDPAQILYDLSKNPQEKEKTSDNINKKTVAITYLTRQNSDPEIDLDFNPIEHLGLSGTPITERTTSKPGTRAHFAESFSKEEMLRIIDASSLGKLQKKYERLQHRKLPEDSIETPEQLKIVHAITNTYKRIQAKRKTLRLAPLGVDPIISQAWKLLKANSRSSEPTRSRNPTKPKRSVSPQIA